METSELPSTLIKIGKSWRTGNVVDDILSRFADRPGEENWVARGEGLLAGRMSRSQLIGSSSRRV